RGNHDAEKPHTQPSCQAFHRMYTRSWEAAGYKRAKQPTQDYFGAKFTSDMRSVPGHERQFREVCGTSALPPRATLERAPLDASKNAIFGLAHCSNKCTARHPVMAVIAAPARWPRLR